MKRLDDTFSLIDTTCTKLGYLNEIITYQNSLIMNRSCFLLLTMFKILLLFKSKRSDTIIRTPYYRKKRSKVRDDSAEHILLFTYNTRIVDDDQATITVIGDLSISVKLEIFMSFVTGMHLAVPLTSALYFNSIAFVMIFVLSSHSTGLSVDTSLGVCVTDCGIHLGFLNLIRSDRTVKCRVLIPINDPPSESNSLWSNFKCSIPVTEWPLSLEIVLCDRSTNLSSFNPLISVNENSLILL
ncbi:hypothetical protein AGLY_014868 [Aphis glycines]|uniref:Uncharacterized protein n=1 Tax=Aphis glycines TaxID=307491 RepID=A0A6G0T332_APHGL|nr:hypothetical protein AGLY_014868 [Aphis glycines]